MLTDGYRPITDDDEELLTNNKRFSRDDINTIGNWILNNIEPSDTVWDRASYQLKHDLQSDTGIYMTNNAFKDAMFLAGYFPTDVDALDWTWKIKKRIPENPNRFHRWCKDLIKINPYKYKYIKAVYDVAFDDEFPIFCDHDIIVNYFEAAGAEDWFIEDFEKYWKIFTNSHGVNGMIHELEPDEE